MEIVINDDQAEEQGSVTLYAMSGDFIASEAAIVVAADGNREITRRWYHLDHLNSTKVITDAAGQANVQYSYRAFGEQLGKLGTGEARHTYGGKELDSESQLYYFNARYYDPAIGRFISVDPAQDGINWYVYCNNNPLSFTDPTGLETESLEQLARLAASGTALLETVVGVVLILIPEPGTTALGIVMVTHGGANVVSSTASNVTYEVTNGEIELSTSAIGLATQAISYNIIRSNGESGDVSKDKAAIFGSVGDLVDGGLSLFIPGPNISRALNLLLKTSTYVNVGSDFVLALTTVEDSITTTPSISKPELQ